MNKNKIINESLEKIDRQTQTDKYRQLNGQLLKEYEK